MNILRRLCFVIATILATAVTAFAGIDNWASTTNYGVGNIVRGVDTNLYIAVNSGMNKPPDYRHRNLLGAGYGLRKFDIVRPCPFAKQPIHDAQSGQ